MPSILSTAHTADLIRQGHKLLLAGDEALLKQLPQGDWIGGTIPYFMADTGGLMTRDGVFVTVLPEDVSAISTRFYDAEALPHIARDEPENGFSFIIIPAFSPLHLSFAENVYGYENIFNRPLMGWVSGIDLDDLGKVTPKVVDGRTGRWSEGDAIVMHASLRPGVTAEIGIVNLFTQGDGDTITFSASGFSVREAEINGVPTNFGEYLTRQAVSTKLPLVADYAGALVNVSIQSINPETGEVQFYAPVFPGVEYKFASPVTDYAGAFADKIGRIDSHPTIAVNCILNYLYGELEGKRTGDIHGPMTFGEIAYGLLNQTLVHLDLKHL
ncbi:DUF6976 family protein [Nitrospirillum sp. BR 11163]|uniref:DUF6976 family protein n=1 Tax=Nitrospirillum sp. BR 11163 TaxID=3104323 RepID=UPI002AFEEBC3|nr:hypothetical protein [Nitrospirillum sp. BR 11163]MEA1672023.1 hypothetical protein [Nitrospirillum sp. BR 11163]